MHTSVKSSVQNERCECNVQYAKHKRNKAQVRQARRADAQRKREVQA